VQGDAGDMSATPVTNAEDPFESAHTELDLTLPERRTSSYCAYETCVAVADLNGYVTMGPIAETTWSRIVPAEAVTSLNGHIGIGNVSDPEGPVLVFSKPAVGRLLEDIKAGTYDSLMEA